MNLADYKFPKVADVDLAFPTMKAPMELVQEAEKRNLSKGRRKFNQIFFEGGSVQLQPDVAGTWKEDAWRFCRALMKSFEPKHEHKEAVCAMIFEECLILE